MSSDSRESTIPNSERKDTQPLAIPAPVHTADQDLPTTEALTPFTDPPQGMPKVPSSESLSSDEKHQALPDEKKSAGVTIVFLDYDACADILFSKEFIQSEYWQRFKAQMTDQDFRALLEKHADALMAKIKLLAGNSKIILMVGSNRQSATVEGEKVAGLHNNGRCFNNYQQLCTDQGWTFNKLLFPDVIHDVPDGTTMQEANDMLDPLDESPSKNGSRGIDGYAYLCIRKKEKYLFNHEAYSGNKGPVLEKMIKRLEENGTLAKFSGPIKVCFIDDRLDILEATHAHLQESFQLPGLVSEIQLIHSLYTTDNNRELRPAPYFSDLPPIIPGKSATLSARPPDDKTIIIPTKEKTQPILTPPQSSPSASPLQPLVVESTSVAHRVHEKFLQKPYSEEKIVGYNHTYDKPLTIGGKIINRHNNNIVTAVRASRLLLAAISFLAENAADPKAKQYYQLLEISLERTELACAAMLYAQTGRESGLGYTDNKKKYKEYRAASADNLTAQFTALGLSPEMIAPYSEALLELGNLEYKPKTKNAKYLQILFTLAQTLDSVRVRKQAGWHKNLLEILNKQGGIADPKALLQLEDYAVALLNATGNRISATLTDSKGVATSARGYKAPFGQLSSDVSECLRVVDGVPPPQFTKIRLDKKAPTSIWSGLFSSGEPSVIERIQQSSELREHLKTLGIKEVAEPAGARYGQAISGPLEPEVVATEVLKLQETLKKLVGDGFGPKVSLVKDPDNLDLSRVHITGSFAAIGALFGTERRHTITARAPKDVKFSKDPDAAIYALLISINDVFPSLQHFTLPVDKPGAAVSNSFHIKPEQLGQLQANLNKFCLDCMPHMRTQMSLAPGDSKDEYHISVSADPKILNLFNVNMVKLMQLKTDDDHRSSAAPSTLYLMS